MRERTPKEPEGVTAPGALSESGSVPDAGDYLAFRALLLEAYTRALAQALPPKPQVARHWESAEQLTFLALLPDQAAFHLAFSFGRLKGTPHVEGAPPQTAGLFRLSTAIFPAIDDARLTKTLTALVPPSVDGATRAFLLRSSAQLATAEVAAALATTRSLIPFATSAELVVTVPRRADALHEPAVPPRIPPHAVERVKRGLRAATPTLERRLSAVFEAPEPTLLDVVRRHPDW